MVYKDVMFRTRDIADNFTEGSVNSTGGREKWRTWEVVKYSN